MPGLFVRSNGEFIEMVEAPYQKESLLQQLLVDEPRLLIGGSGTVGGRSYLLLRPEQPVRAEEDGGNRWSLDHLFVDSLATPVLVEVKRSSDTRIRREVVGQMLDYAANGVAYWSMDEIRAEFSRSLEYEGKSADEVISEFSGREDVESFWRDVATNLKAGRLRLLFVADSIPRELRRIVEFLNGQMTETEVLAVEVRQHEADDGSVSVYVSEVIGQSEAAARVKERNDWDEESGLAELGARYGAASSESLRELLGDARGHGFTIRWGSGKNPTVGIRAIADPKPVSLVWLESSGNLYMKLKAPEDGGLPLTDEMRDRVSVALSTDPGWARGIPDVASSTKLGSLEDITPGLWAMLRAFLAALSPVMPPGTQDG